MDELLKLTNIGEDTKRQLNEIGIRTPEELKKMGSKEVWLKIKSVDPSACIHRLYALEGAIRGIKKKDLTEEVKLELKSFYNKFK